MAPSTVTKDATAFIEFVVVAPDAVEAIDRALTEAAARIPCGATRAHVTKVKLMHEGK